LFIGIYYSLALHKLNNQMERTMSDLKTESSYYMSTNALMHEPNNELYVFNVCNNCETVF
jgi:hypothetical protein